MEIGVVRCPTCRTANRVAAAATGHPTCGRCQAPLPWITQAVDGDFDAVAARASIPVLVDLWAPWCGPCRAVGPAVERTATDLAGRVKVVKVNVDDAPATAARFGARSIPTLLVLREGRVVSRIVGARSAGELRRWVEEALTSDAAV